MAGQLGISLGERQRCATDFRVRLGERGSETLQLIHQAYGDDAMRRAAVFKWWKRFRDGETSMKDEILMNHSAGKVMHILFFDARGIILQHWVPPG
jgi:hypothetical protein